MSGRSRAADGRYVSDRSERYASHLEALTWAVASTDGPVLELGGGWFSTPMLHGLCEATHRELVTVETNAKMREELQCFASPCHEIVRPGRDGLHPDLVASWSVVFVDHGIAARRQESIRRYADLADRIVVHDTQPDVAQMYPGMAEALRGFAHRRDFTRVEPHTAVVWR